MSDYALTRRRRCRYPLPLPHLLLCHRLRYSRPVGILEDVDTCSIW